MEIWDLGSLLLISFSLKDVHLHLCFKSLFTEKLDPAINVLVAWGILGLFFDFLIFPSKKIAVCILFYVLCLLELFMWDVVAVLFPGGGLGLRLTLMFEC